MDLQGAIERVAAAVIPDSEAREDALLRFDQELDRWLEEPDYLTADLDALVLRACRLMGLPEDLARTWRKLPKVVYDRPADDATADDAAPAPSPHRDSGWPRDHTIPCHPGFAAGEDRDPLTRR